MARIETSQRTLYQFAELSEDAKGTARNWFRGCIEPDELPDYDDWQTIARILGIEFKTERVPLMGGSTRHDPVIYWALNPDSAAFAGWYSYAKGAPKAIRAHAPQDETLHTIADTLQSVQRRNFYRITATCETRGRDGTSQRVESDCEDIAEPLTDFAHWIAMQVSAQWDYLNSDEYVDDCILCNEYEFDSEGNIA